LSGGVVVLGSFVADLAFRAGRLPAIGETLEGTGFKMGPGGKGSNQAVAAARAGAGVTFITRLAADEFGRLARDTWAAEGIVAAVTETTDAPTGAAFIYVDQLTGANAIIVVPGAAFIFVDEKTGANAIIVVPGAAGTIAVADVDASAEAIRRAGAFLTQLEEPVPAAIRGLEIARAAGVPAILNPAPAPAKPLPDAIYPLCDYITPNETEAALITGLPVGSVDDARRAGDALLKKGARVALITLGAAGALFHTRDMSEQVPAFDAGPVVETAGAGDAFAGAFAAALTRGLPPLEAARFASAAAGISVTRPGTAPSMPMLAEIEALLARSR
jgi:ribokinase